MYLKYEDAVANAVADFSKNPQINPTKQLVLKTIAISFQIKQPRIVEVFRRKANSPIWFI
jgi:hypothetical protein